MAIPLEDKIGTVQATDDAVVDGDAGFEQLLSRPRWPSDAPQPEGWLVGSEASPTPSAPAAITTFEAARGRRQAVRLTRLFRREDVADAMPATAKFLIDMIGLDATLKLVKAEGGNDLPIPEVVDGASHMWHHLSEMIGREAATALVERCAGTSVYIPKCEAALRIDRNRDILESFDRGEGFETIRRRHDITRSYLYRLLKRPAP